MPGLTELGKVERYKESPCHKCIGVAIGCF